MIQPKRLAKRISNQSESAISLSLERVTNTGRRRSTWLDVVTWRLLRCPVLQNPKVIAGYRQGHVGVPLYILIQGNGRAQCTDRADRRDCECGPIGWPRFHFL